MALQATHCSASANKISLYWIARSLASALSLPQRLNVVDVKGSRYLDCCSCEGMALSENAL
jgi:hypothetical protein